MGLSQKRLAESVGETQTNIAAYETGETEPNPSIAFAISKVLKVRKEWLLTGEPPMKLSSPLPLSHLGEMRPKANNQKIGAADQKDLPLIKKDEPVVLEMVDVPVMEGEAALGEPTVVQDKVRETIRLPRRVLPHPSLCHALRVQGESMAPLIEKGMLVVLDRARRDPYMLRGRIVAVRLDDYVTIKRLIEQDGRFHIVADNPTEEFRSIELDLRGGNLILGEIIYVVR